MCLKLPSSNTALYRLPKGAQPAEPAARRRRARPRRLRGAGRPDAHRGRLLAAGALEGTKGVSRNGGRKEQLV